MAKKMMNWKTRGMNRDLSVSAFNPEFAFENMNLRLCTNEGNTMMSWVTEKGTQLMTLRFNNVNQTTLSGNAIGTAVIDNTLVLFTTTKLQDTLVVGTDYIYLIEVGDDLTYLDVTAYYQGDLNLDTNHPITTLVSYESGDLKKVYWVDGKNPLRMLNVCDVDVLNTDSDRFNVLPTLRLEEKVKVSKVIGGSGKFPSGVIQYAFTYYNKHSSESNIFYVSSLRYISPIDRGAAPNETVNNAFDITIEKVDQNFDYLRIYSIQRTSLNGTPICKRVADIDIPKDAEHEVTVSFIDTGTTGELIDPTELLYKNREPVIAKTIEQKDNTLFLGNITRKFAQTAYVSNHTFNNQAYELAPGYFHDTIPSRNSGLDLIMSGYDASSGYPYTNQLNLKNGKGESGVPSGGFKIGNTYRLGIQLQDKCGKWTDPIWLQDYTVPKITESGNDNYHAKMRNYGDAVYLQLPRIKCTLNTDSSTTLYQSGYRKVRPLIVFPEAKDRKHICQGVICPTVYTEKNRTEDKSLYAQSSWFFRPIANNSSPARFSYLYGAEAGTDRHSDEWSLDVSSPYSVSINYIPYAEDKNSYEPTYTDLKTVEIQGIFRQSEQFQVDWQLNTMHLPDAELEDLNWSSFEDTRYTYVGDAKFVKTLSDIDIQTESPQIESSASGFVHTNYNSPESYGIIAGLFYDDAAAIDKTVNDTTSIKSFLDSNYNNEHAEKVPYKWMVYPWHRSGSLNNDFDRPSGLGVQSAVLKKKTISNLRFANTEYNTNDSTDNTVSTAFEKGFPTVFNNTEGSLVKLAIKNASSLPIADAFYEGNIDTLLSPVGKQPLFFSFDGEDYNDELLDLDTPTTKLSSRKYWKAYKANENFVSRIGGLYKYKWNHSGTDDAWGVYDEGTSTSKSNTEADDSNLKFGEKYLGVVESKDSVRMKYKSSSHLLFYPNEAVPYTIKSDFYLPIYEITRDNVVNPFGGTNIDSLKSNAWIVCGEEVRLCNNAYTLDPIRYNTEVYFEYADMYYQRYDCLKTYAYSPDDINQIVEIGSFMLESYINCDGRYDRNRGQINNLNMSPQNFNLFNPVYSQPNNFFSYKIVEDDTSDKEYVNYITWSKTKTSGEQIDTWTDLTLASTLELEGNKGVLSCIKKFKNELFTFQDKGVAQIRYNQNVQISTSAGVPIELANSGKVDGFWYLSNTIGCSNAHSIVETPAGLYFMDSFNKAIYLFNGEFTNISAIGGMNSWCKQNIPESKSIWTPRFNTYPQPSSAQLSGFVAYYDKLNQEVLFINKDTALAWNERVQAFTSFYSYKDTPYLASVGDFELWFRLRNPDNPDDYTTITTVWRHQAGECCNFFGEPRGYWTTLVGNPEPTMDKTFTNLEFRACVEGDGEYNVDTGKFTPTLPFDNLEVWDEYQHGIANLENGQGHDLYTHNSTADGQPASLIRKFRMWRCDIPRDNAVVDIRKEAPMGISRSKAHPLSRMRNPWLYLTLRKQPLVTYRYQRLGSIKGFIIPISEFTAYKLETGRHTCRIADINGATGIASVLYHLIDTTDNYAQKLFLDGNFWNKLPLPNVPIDGPGGLETLASQYGADALLIDASNWGFDPATLEITIYRTEDLRRVELHDLQLTYFD